MTLPPKVEIDAQLQDLSVDADSAEIQWRRLSEQELSFIDGIQLRYRDVDVDAQVWVGGKTGGCRGRTWPKLCMSREAEGKLHSVVEK